MLETAAARPPARSSREARGIRDSRRGGASFLTAMVLVYGWVWICAVSLVGAMVPVLAMRGAPWRGDVIWTVDWLSIGFVIIGPVISGFVAVDTARLSAGSAHLRARGWRQSANGIGLGYAVVITATYCLLVVGALVVSRPARLDSWTWLAVLAQIAMLWFFIAVGALAGRLVRPLLAGAIAAMVALVAVFTLSSPTGHVALLDGGAATVPRIGFTYAVGYLGLQLLALALVSAALTLVPARADGGLQTMSGRARVVTAMLIAAGSTVALLGPEDRLSPVEAAPTSCGAVASVPVCVYPEHRRVVEAFDQELWVLFESARAAGYGSLVPDRVEEAHQTSLTGGPGVGPLYVTSDALSGADPTTWEVALNLVQPVHCEGVRGELPPREQYWTDLLALTGTWVNLVDPSLGEQNGYYEANLSPEAATALLEQFQTCTYQFA